MSISSTPNLETPIKQLKNLGYKSAHCLAEINIHNLADLKQLGSIATYLKIEREANFKPSLNFLYAMEGALQNVHWAKIDQQEKARLLISLEDARIHQNMFHEIK